MTDIEVNMFAVNTARSLQTVNNRPGESKELSADQVVKDAKVIAEFVKGKSEPKEM